MLFSNKSTNGWLYNQPIVYEVTTLIIGGMDTIEERYIIIKTKEENLQWIYEFHAIYLTYQYALIFSYGDNGYRPNVTDIDLEIFEDNQRNILTFQEWLAIRIQTRCQ